MGLRIAGLVLVVLIAVPLSGCLGGDDLEGPPRASVRITAVDDEEDTFLFDASPSRGRDLAYAWDLGDRTTATGVRAQHAYVHGDGTYQVALTVTDADGATDEWIGTVVVGTGENAAPVAAFSPDRRVYTVGQAVTVDATATFDPEDDPVFFQWDFNHLMDYQEYEAFRAAKTGALQATGEDDGGQGVDPPYGPSGLQQAPPGPVVPSPTEDRAGPTDLLDKKHHHDRNQDDNRIQPSTFSRVVSTEQPVWVLEEGFPDATVFFIRLQVWDVKGAHETIRSEEIWPVRVFAETIPATTAGGTSGRFTFGAPDEATGLLPDTGGQVYEHEAEWTFELDWPVADAQDDGGPGGFVNLSWQAADLGVLPTDVHMEVTAPDGTVIGSEATDAGRASLLVDAARHGIGTWTVHLFARAGVEIEWTLHYWARLHQNPFEHLED